MAGLACAARARELGLEPVVYEKGDRAGGSMLLSSCVPWRHLTVEDFRAECPGGDPALQRLVVERLDEALAWLERLGAPVVERETGNPATAGMRFDPRGLTDALVRAAGDVRFETPAHADARPLVLATGGFQGNDALVREHVRPAAPLLLRANRWSTGDGLLLALSFGAATTAGMDEFYGRNMSDAMWREEDFVPLAQVYGKHALVVNDLGEEFAAQPVSWSETELVQATARQPGARAWYLLDEAALAERVRERTVGAVVDAARAAGGTVARPSELPFEAPAETVVAVRVAAAITHTIGGLRIDDQARVLEAGGAPIDGLLAAGADAGGVSTGGYASGLAAALVLGRTAAETAAG
jgi:succinate dehydrogenase/fumarate reductase flavoprotein subunit